MRKLIIFSTIFLFLSKLAYTQTFEGKITYENSVKSKIPGLSDERLGSLIGTRQEYFIKEGRYKSMTNGGITMQLYDDKTNRVYNKRRDSDTLYWFDASTNTDTVVSYEIKKDAAVILGKHCDALIAKTRTGTTTFYYCKEYKVASAKYRHHSYGNWAFFVQRTGVLPLKTVIEIPQFRMESTAVEIKGMGLPDSSFEIGQNTPVKKATGQ